MQFRLDSENRYLFMAEMSDDDTVYTASPRTVWFLSEMSKSTSFITWINEILSSILAELPAINKYYFFGI